MLRVPRGRQGRLGPRRPDRLLHHGLRWARLPRRPRAATVHVWRRGRRPRLRIDAARRRRRRQPCHIRRMARVWRARGAQDHAQGQHGARPPVEVRRRRRVVDWVRHLPCRRGSMAGARRLVRASRCRHRRRRPPHRRARHGQLRRRRAGVHARRRRALGRRGARAAVRGRRARRRAAAAVGAGSRPRPRRRPARCVAREPHVRRRPRRRHAAPRQGLRLRRRGAHGARAGRRPCRPAWRRPASPRDGQGGASGAGGVPRDALRRLVRRHVGRRHHRLLPHDRQPPVGEPERAARAPAVRRRVRVLRPPRPPPAAGVRRLAADVRALQRRGARLPGDAAPGGPCGSPDGGAGARTPMAGV
mmetsp:Transcript_25312/g.88339  ORF Transcript_25312/g.88339 Transcript_25312/m.88339 type:complete len:360 (-) Transcript_25312:312-1391(-)